MKSESVTRCRFGIVRHQLWVLAIALVGVAILFGTLPGPTQAAGWYEDWNDGNAVNPPLDWANSAAFPGSYDPTSGNYVLTGLDVQEPIGFADNDDEILSAIAVSGDEYQTFSGQVSIRTRARINMEEGQHGNIGLIAFSGPNLAAAPSAYGVLVDDQGETEIDVFTATSPVGPFLIHFIDDDLGLPPEMLPITDVYVQFDNVITPDSNATMSITVWQPGQLQPAEPQTSVDISAYVEPDTLITGAEIMSWVPTEGPAGIVFNEDPNDIQDPKTPEGTGTFFWTVARLLTDPASGSLLRLTNGDVNDDGAVNGLDVNPFVTRVIGGEFAPLADMNSDDAVNGLDVSPFVAAVISGGNGAHVVPEPSTLLLAAIALVALGWLAARRRSS